MLVTFQNISWSIVSEFLISFVMSNDDEGGTKILGLGKTVVHRTGKGVEVGTGNRHKVRLFSPFFAAPVSQGHQT
jgi:hypothetical protein